ncbi:MAG TPA: ATP-grasp domain-containing protein [Gemmatimonadaceae bacterium]
MKILVTGAGALLGQGIIRSIQRSALGATIVAVDPSPQAVGLYWADRAHLIPMASDPAYMDVIRALLATERPDVVLIGTDIELPLFARERAALEAEFSTAVLVSDERVTAIANDKWLTNQFLRERGFPHPAACLPGDEEKLIELVGFPLLVKPRVGARSVGVGVVHDRDALRAALAGRSDLVIQEYVATHAEEYTAGALRFDGQEVQSIVMRRDLRDGNTFRAFVEDYPEFNEEIRRLANALAPYGPANFQFRSDNGVVKVFEINGRFSGTTPLRARVGFNEVEMAVRFLLNGTPLSAPVVQTGVTLLRYWDEQVVDTRHAFDG